MTAILTSDNGPCIMRRVTRGAATFEVRTYPICIALMQDDIARRQPTRARHRDARGRFDGRKVFA